MKRILISLFLAVAVLCGCSEKTEVNNVHIKAYDSLSFVKAKNEDAIIIEENLVEFVVEDSGYYLQRSDTLKNGTYVIDTTDLDKSKAGVYTVKVTGQSTTGEKSEKEITITIREE